MKRKYLGFVALGVMCLAVGSADGPIHQEFTWPSAMALGLSIFVCYKYLLVPHFRIKKKEK